MPQNKRLNNDEDGGAEVSAVLDKRKIQVRGLDKRQIN